MGIKFARLQWRFSFYVSTIIHNDNDRNLHSNRNKYQDWDLQRFWDVTSVIEIQKLSFLLAEGVATCQGLSPQAADLIIRWKIALDKKIDTILIYKLNNRGSGGEAPRS